MNIYQKINAVMKSVKYVQKDAKIQGYKAVTHDQVVSVARQQFVDNGIVMRVNQVAGSFEEKDANSKMRLYTGKYEISFVNIEDPNDCLVEVIEAHALDNGDKAPGKCCTYAVKTAVLKVLWLETGENDESREEVREASRVVTPGQAVELGKYCYNTLEDGGIEWTKVGQKLAQAYNIASVQDLPASKFNEAIKRCEAANANN